MPIQKVISKGRVPVKIYTEDIDYSAINQLANLAQLDFIHHHVAVMPDVHVGIGATIGSVIPTKGAIIPAAVGVDIGCGMNAVRLSLKASQLPDSLVSLRHKIEDVIPCGFNQHKKDRVRRSTTDALYRGIDKIVKKHPAIARMQPKKPYTTWIRQLATLGGGNHFIELCIDENQDVWVMLHSGSRGIGNIIGRYFINLAQKNMGKDLGRLPDKNLAYFSQGEAWFDDYIEAVHWAQDYAMINRREMMIKIVDVLKQALPPFKTTKEAVNCHHNYVNYEAHYGAGVYVTRKGAISARQDELGIIPGSMGAKSYIVRGLGNPESFCSCSHGAGRVMSRSKAKRQFSSKDMDEQTKGVECRKDKKMVDEIPAAYKDIDTVMKNQNDLVAVVHTLKQVICVKG